MPPLENEDHERFCYAYVENGKDLEDAYLDAGYEGSRDHALRLLKRPEVAARIAEVEIEHAELQELLARAAAQRTAVLRALQADLAGASRKAVVARLLEIAHSANLSEPAGMREARITLLEAFKLTQRLHEHGDASAFPDDNAIWTPTRRPPALHPEPTSGRPTATIEPPAAAIDARCAAAEQSQPIEGNMR